MTDELIVALYLQRKERALEETARKYGGYLYTVANNLLGDPEDSHEIVNDVYLRTWNAIPPAQPAALSTFLAKIARNLAIDRLRAKGSQRRTPSEYALSLEELGECVSGGGDPQRTVETRQLAEAVNSWLYTRPTEQRNLFVCRYFFGDSLKELARRSGSTVSRIKSLLRRERLSLKHYLDQEGLL